METHDDGGGGCDEEHVMCLTFEGGRSIVSFAATAGKAMAKLGWRLHSQG